ncbi:hypothetical protein P4E94_17840 [Pontiellaceae bacterium B12219]|nr:hypothetical protein [Pontiellaceae bacterium B12219]
MKTHISLIAVSLVCFVQNTALATEISNTSESITSIEQADAIVRETQKQFWQLVPPGMPLYVHSERKARPLVWTDGWPEAFKKNTYPEMVKVNGFDYPIYRLWAVADESGNLTYFNIHNEAVWTSPAPAGYSQYGYLMSRLGIESEDELTEKQKQLSASNVGMEIQLTIDSVYEFYEQDVAAESQTTTLSAEPMMAMSAPPPPDGTSTNGGSGGTNYYQTASLDYGDELYLGQNLTLDSDGWLDIHNAEVGQEYEIYYTYDLQYVRFDTNTSSYSTAWPAKTGLIGESDNVAYWSAPLVGENALNRDALFFRAYEFSDSDGDGLSDIYELMITKTSHTNAMSVIAGVFDRDLDQDGDGLSHYEEYLGLGQDIYTHPRIADTDNDNRNDDVDPWPMDGAGAVDTDGDRMPDDLYLNRTSTSNPQLVADPDDDNDRFSDAEESIMGSNSKDAASPGSAAYTDSDSDGLFDWEDPYPNDPDGDNDDIGDGYEKLVLGTSPTVTDNHSAGDIAAYNAVKDDADSDGRPQWVESSDSTNPDDGLDFAVNIF